MSSCFLRKFWSAAIGTNGEQLKEMRDLEPKYFLLTQYLLVAEMLYSFLPTLKIQNFREAAICRQKTYTKTRTFFRCCYTFVCLFQV
jgi:hypothetical protein